MELAMLQLAGLLNGQQGFVGLSESTGEPEFFALTLQSLSGELPGPGAGKTGAPWGRGMDFAFLASLSGMAEGLTSGDSPLPGPPVDVVDGSDAAPVPHEWFTLLGKFGQSDTPEKAEAELLSGEEGEGPELINLFRFFRDLEVDRPMPRPVPGGPGPGKGSPIFGGTQAVASERASVEQLQRAGPGVSAAPLAVDSVAPQDSRIPLMNRSGEIWEGAVLADQDRRASKEVASTLEGGDRRRFGAEGQAPAGKVFVGPAVDGSQAAAPRSTTGDKSALPLGPEDGAERNPLNDGPVVPVVDPVRGDSGKPSPSREFPGQATRPDTLEAAAVPKPEERPQGKEPPVQPREQSSHSAAAAAAPSYDGGGETKIPSPLEDGGLTPLEHGTRSVNRPTEGQLVDHRWPSEPLSRPDSWAGRVLGQIESHMQRMVLKGREKVILRLEPESLGKLKMEVSLSDQGVNAKMTTDSAAAREIIFTHVHALKEALLEQGFRVENLQVHFQEEMGESGFRDANHAHDHRSQDGLREEGERRYPSGSETEANPEESDATAAPGRVNVFA